MSGGCANRAVGSGQLTVGDGEHGDVDLTDEVGDIAVQQSAGFTAVKGSRGDKEPWWALAEPAAHGVDRVIADGQHRGGAVDAEAGECVDGVFGVQAVGVAGTSSSGYHVDVDAELGRPRRRGRQGLVGYDIAADGDGNRPVEGGTGAAETDQQRGVTRGHFGEGHRTEDGPDDGSTAPGGQAEQLAWLAAGQRPAGVGLEQQRQRAGVVAPAEPVEIDRSVLPVARVLDDGQQHQVGADCARQI